MIWIFHGQICKKKTSVALNFLIVMAQTSYNIASSFRPDHTSYRVERTLHGGGTFSGYSKDI